MHKGVRHTMDFLDMKTVLVTILATDILCTVVLTQLWRQSRERFAGTGLWAADFAFHTLAFFLILLRGAVPDWMSILLANALALTGALWGYMGLQRFVGLKGSQRHNCLVLVAFVLVHSYFTFVQPDLRFRSINVSLGLLIICSQCAWLMLVKTGPPLRSLTRSVGLVFGGFCALSMFRVFWLLKSPDVGQDYFRLPGPEVLAFVLYQLLLVLLTYDLSLMMNKRLLVGIKSEEEKLSRVFHCVPYAIMLTRLSDGRIVKVNEGFEKTTGYSSEDALGKTTVDLRLWKSREDRAGMMNELSGGGMLQNRELQFRTRTGEIRTGLVTSETITVENEKNTISSIVDITGRKQAEEERFRLEQRLQQAEKAGSLARMAGAVAHNFNNILFSVTGNLKLALYGLPEEPGSRRYITEALKASLRASEVSRLMLSYLGQTTRTLEPVDIAGVIRDVCALMSSSVPQNVRLQTDIPPLELIIRADSAHLAQIFTNLITNAVEAAGEDDAEILVTAEILEGADIREPRFLPLGWEPEAREYVRVSIADTGCGIDEATLDKIFDPFFTTKFTGRGLGLSVAMGLVGAFYGAVSVESHPGRGTVFRVYFPLQESKPLSSP